MNSFIEFAIENTLNSVNISEGGYNEAPTSIGSVADQLWDVDEPDRFAKLALRYPEILTYDEQLLWKLVRETSGLWRGQYDNKENWTWKVIEAMLIFERLREYWQVLKDIARGDALKTQLPVWIWDRHRPVEPNPTPLFDPDDVPPPDEDIPF